MSGNTVNSLRRNVIDGDFGLLALAPGSTYLSSKHELHVPTSKGTKTCYCFGGGDIDSRNPLQGLTVGGWYGDEITRQHPEFIQEAFNRSLTNPESENYWTLNPDNPDNEIYSNHIDRWIYATAQERIAAGGVNYYHFTLKDNPVYSDADIARIAAQYTGFEYERYILGRRVAAEGLIYAGIASRPYIFQDLNPADVYVRYCAIDFGTDHPNVIQIGGPFFEASGVKNPRKWAIVREDYDERKDKTTDDIVNRFELLCASVMADPKLMQIAISPDAKTLRNSFIRRGYAGVISAKNEVLEGLRFTKDCLYNGSLILDTSCKGTRREMGIYSWNPKPAEKGKEEPIKKSDDGCDTMRYFAMTHARPYL